MQNQLRHASFFSGIGGCSSALKQAKIPHTTLSVSEIEDLALNVYKAIHGDVPPNIGDITKVDPSEVPTDIDIWTGGPPCQDFSGLGESLGFAADLSPMMAYQDLIIDCLPAYVLMENVGAILWKKHSEGLNNYLNPLKEFYNIQIVKDNPHDFGWLQSRTRVWFLMSRKDVPQWKAPKITPLAKPQIWGDIASNNPRQGSFIEVLDDHRIGKDKDKGNWDILPSSSKFNCFCRRTVDSRCSRGSWPRYKSHWRSPTDNETFELFGYLKYPKNLILKTKGVSRSSFYMAAGNSWHVGYASQLFSSLPYQEYLQLKRDRFLQSFINMDSVSRLLGGKISRSIRSVYQWEDLMTTPKGNPRKLTATTSHKFDMRNGHKIETMGMYLAPSTEAGFKINTCSNSGDCKNMCLITTGQLVTGAAASSRIEKTRAFYAYPIQFLTQLLDEISAESGRAHRRGDGFQYRANGTSDIMWERYINMESFVASVAGFDGFYDYTKNGKRRLKNIPPSYHLTFSVDEKANSFSNAVAYLEAGYSVAIVLHEFEKQIALLMDGPIVDGDLSDHRPQDPAGSIVLLRSKGKARKSQSGFIKPASFIRGLVSYLELSNA